ncbi:MAG TPA: hypothetical protein VNK52_04650 [Hyphomicrobiaceae bacterium]|nr:hypothetical protein [Hyphomicrobiaceae bacterium]
MKLAVTVTGIASRLAADAVVRLKDRIEREALEGARLKRRAAEQRGRGRSDGGRR